MNKVLSRLLSGTVSVTSLVLMPSVVSAGTAPTPSGIVWERTNKTASNYAINHPFVQWLNPNSTKNGTTTPLLNSDKKIVAAGIFGGVSKIIYFDPGYNGGQLFWVDADKNGSTPTYIGNGGLNTNSFYVAGTGNFFGSGEKDGIVFRGADGTTVVWRMSSAGSIITAKLIQAAPTDFDLVAVGNFNGSGVDDIIFHHKTNGALVNWNLVDSGSSFTPSTGSGQIGTYSNSIYEFKYGDDIDGDGDMDLLLRRKDLGNVAEIIKTQGGALVAQIQIGDIGTLGVAPPSGNGTTDYSPEIIYKPPTTLPLTVSSGVNSKVAKDLGNISQSTSVVVGEGEVSGPLGYNTDSYFKFTLTQLSDVVINLSTSDVKGHGSDTNGNIVWGTIGSSNSSSNNFKQTTGKFNLTPGTYYYRVQNKVGSSSSQTTTPFTISIKAQAPSSTPTITDIDPGDEGSGVIGGANLGSNTYFISTQGDDIGLWKTDGTVNGTSRVKSFVEAESEIFVYNSALYFTADGKLWKSNGTESGTVLVKDIYPGNDAQIESFITSGGSLYFIATDSTGTADIWKTNGTTSGTVKYVDFTDDNSNPAELINFNGQLVYVANPDGNGRRIWRKPTTGNPVAVTSTSVLNAQELTVAGSNLFAAAAVGGVNSQGEEVNVELIRVNASWGVTTIDVNTGTASSTPTSLTAWGNDIYFSAIGSSGREMYRANATSGSATLIYDAYPGNDSNGEPNSSNPSGFTLINNQLYYRATDAAYGSELWKYNGSTSPSRITDIASGSASSFPYDIVEINNTVVFAASSDDTNFEPYFLSGSNAVQIKDINSGSNGSYPIAFLETPNGKGFFAANTNGNGFEPWITNGTSQGTFQLKNINTKQQGVISEGIHLNGWYYFSAYDKDKGQELYRTNGSTTQLVMDIETGVGSSSPTNFVSDGTYVYFSATKDGVTKLWRTNGSSTQIAVNINGATETDSIGEITNVGSTIYFTASNSSAETVVYRFTGSGSAIVSKNFGTAGFVTEMKALGSNVWVSATDTLANGDAEGFLPWKLTGSTATKISQAGSDNIASPYEFVKTDNGDVYFAAIVGEKGYELVRVASNATVGTLVSDTNPGAGSSNLTSITALGNTVFFAAYNGSNLTYYRTTGTPASTKPALYLNMDLGMSEDLNFIDQPDNGLQYRDYQALFPVVSASGKSIYTVGSFQNRIYDAKWSAGHNFCGVSGDGVYFQTRTGRVALQDFETEFQDPQLNNTQANTAYGFTNGNSTPSGLWNLKDVNALVSTEYGVPCTFSSFYNNKTYYAPIPDSRISQYENVRFGYSNGNLFIAGFTSKNGGVDIWKMPHSETFTNSLNGFGMPRTRNITYVGKFDIEFGTFEFNPSNTSMFIRGFDPTSKTNKQWKVQ